MNLRHVAILVAGIGMVGCGEPPVRTPNPAESVTGVSVVPSSLIMQPGDRVNLTATVFAGSAQSNLRVHWTSTNPAVASVDSNGVVSGIANGTTTITATSLADSRFSGSCVVTLAGLRGTITIAEIEDDGGPADLANVSGNIDVIVNMDNGATTVLRVEALLSGEKGDTAVASYSPGSSTGQASGGVTRLSFNTIGLKNGPYLLKVRTTLLGGSVVVSASVQLTVKNP